MELYKLKAHEIRELIIKKEVTAEEVTNAFLKRIEEIDDKLGAFLYVDKEGALEKAREIDKKIKNGEKVGSLAGVPIVIKDNISVTGMQNTCASKILEGYTSPYDAYIIKKVKESDAIILGKSNMDEFAMGSSGETSAYKITKNPWDIERVPGGSSSGSAASVAGMEAPISIGTETGGSVRQPASLCGIVGLKPTYGRISRNGIVAFGSTLDQAGPFARDVEDCALLTNVIAGYDEGDFTTSKEEVQDYTKFLSKDIKGIKVGIPSEFFKEGLDEEIKNTVLKAVEVLKENGAEIKEISLPLADYALADYYIIACAEASSNLGRFDGIRYGKRSKDAADSVDIYFKSRSEGFGEEVKRRIMLGTYVLSAGYYDAYYKKALKVRNLIKKDFEKAFNEVDVIISPTSPTTAFKIGEKTKDVLSMYLSDIYTVPVNIAGIPAISVPCGMVNNLPVGLQIIGNYFEEGKLFNVAYSFEQSTEWHKNIANV